MIRNVLASMLLLAGCAHPSRTPRAAAPGTPTLRVLTYNVNFGLAGDEAGLKAIENADADIVFLQETTDGWEDAIRARFAEKYPQMVFHQSPGAGGQGVLSKLPFEEKDWIPAPTGWFPALRVIVEAPFGKVQVLSVHLHPMVTESGSYVRGYLSTGPVREGEMDVYAKALDPALPTLVVGDFNENAKGPAVGVLKARGMKSALPEFAPKAKTWHWNTSVGELKQQLDHVMYDAALDPLEVKVLNGEGRSDHDPVLAVFAAKAAVPESSSSHSSF